MQDYIKHIRFKDVCIQIDKKVITSQGTFVTGQYMCMGCWYLGVDFRMFIHKKDYSNWMLCVEPHKKSLREARWSQWE